jgi:hypothetical protein
MNENEFPQNGSQGKDIEAWLRIVLADERQKHLREVMELKFAAKDAMNEVAKLELARRLDALNHEAEQLKKMQATYVSVEKYEGSDRAINEKLNEIRDWKNNSMGRQTIITVVLSFVISLAFVLLNWILKVR